MAKQLNVSLAFTADTREVKARLQDLQNQLNKLALSSNTELGITKDIEDASRAAAELSVHLKNATNQQTGSLDFSKLNQSIKQSGTSLQQYGRTLQSLGPQGQQAFMSLAQAVANSEVPIRRTNAMLKEMGTTLANTARWQLSSSVLHGFMGAVQSAYGYAQDLNESLNNIRIVTGQNIDQMAKFAEEANKAARALSTTTTEYTNASLIYYQQGLNDQQVKERTDITIKMANVARQSAEVVSDQMTAVWNNFYDGSKSLEHYADVMTALGAATASSTDEISEGLNKFAAVADTVGLSYEYAASALATVTATTRQSADVVGTAFKTLFARLQDLELNKTLDDGTTLGKYSAALDAVGINIKNANGDMKDMDRILDELGNKWGDLSKDTQVALAQTVAGTRQYTQLVALMDNWDYFQSNLGVANNSSGALQEQADIYAESWEAAADRVTAAAENVYKALINDEFFVDLLNGVEKVISFVDHLIDNLGGLKGVLSAIGAIVTKVFANQLSQGLTNLTYNLKMMTEKGRQVEKDARKKFIDDAVDSIPQNKEYTTDVEKAQQNSMRSQLTLQQQYMENVDKMNGVEAEVNKKLMDRVRLLQEAAVAAEQRKEKAHQTAGDLVYDIETDIYDYNKRNADDENYVPVQWSKKVTDKKTGQTTDIGIQGEIDTIKNASKIQADAGSAATKVLADIKTQATTTKQSIEDFKKQIASMPGIPDSVKKSFADLNEASTVEDVEAAMEELNKEMDLLIKNSSGNIKDVVSPETAKKVDQLTAALREKAKAQVESAEAADNARRAEEKAAEGITNATGKQRQWADILVESANLAFSAASAFQMLGSAFETIMDPDISGWEKFLTILTTLSMIIPTLVSIYNTFKSLLSAETVAKLANVAATIAQVGAEKALNQERGKSHTTTRQNIQKTNEDTKQKLKDIWKKNSAADWDKADEATQRGYIEKYLQSQGYTRGQTQKGGVQNWIAPGKAPKTQTSAMDIAKSDPKVLQGAKGMFGKAGSASLGGVAASVGFIAAGIAVIAGGIAWGVYQATKAERAVEKAREATKGLQEQLSNVSTAYSDFSNAVDTFKNAEDGLENLTKGTQEYQQAVYGANEAAMALLETNKNLNYEIADGRITFDEGELDKALADQRDAVTRAQAAKYAGDAELMRAEENLAKRNLSRDLDSKADFGQKAGNVAGATGTGLLGGAAMGAGIGALVGGGVFSWATAGIGALIGAIAGLVGGIVTGMTVNNTLGTAVDYESQALDKIAKAYEQDSSFMAKEGVDLEAYFRDELKIDDTDLVTSLVNNKDELQNLAEQMKQNAALIDAQNDLIASQLLADNSVVTSSEYQDAIIDKSGDVYDQLLQDALNSEGTKNWGKTGISQATGVNKEAQDVFDDYLRYAGLEGRGYKLIDTTGNDENRKFVYLDENGDEKQVALTTMQYAKATYEATNQMDAVGRELANAFAEWGVKEDAASQAMLSFVTTDTFEDATENEYNAISKVVDEAGSIEQYLTNTLGDLEAAAEKYGYESAEELINAFTVALANGSTAWNDIDLPHLNDAVKKNITISTAQQIENLIRVMNAGPLGEEAGKEFSEGLNKMLAGMGTEDKEEALRRITEIDWSSYDTADQVRDIIEELGYTVNMTDAEFEAWVQTMNAANQAYIDYGALLEKLKEIKGIVSDLKVGDIISKEDLEKLEKYNEELAKYFRTLGTGEGQLIGDLLDLLQKVEELEQTDLRDAISETQKALQIAEQQQAVNDTANQYGGADYLKGKATYDTTETKIVQNDPNAGHYILGFLSSMGNALSNSQSADPGIEANARSWAGTTKVSTTTTHVDTNHYRKQLEFLNAYGYDTSGFTSANNNPSVEMAEAVSTAIGEVLERNPPVSAEEFEQLQANILGSQIDYIMTADSAEERQAMLDSGKVSADAFEVAAMQAHNEEKWEGMDPKEVEEYADALMDAAENSELLFDNISEEAAEDVALYTIKMNNGIESLAENFEEWSIILQDSNSASEEYADAMNQIKNAMSDVLGVSEEFLSNGFVLQNMKDIEMAARGDAEAIDRLAIAAGRDILINTNFENNNIKDEVLSLHDQLVTEIPDFELGVSINDQEFLSKAQKIVQTAGMTVEEANAYFRSLGFEAKFKTNEVTIPITGTRTITTIKEWSDGGFLGIGRYPTVMETSTEEYPTGESQTISVPAFSTDGSEPSIELTKTNSGAMNNSSSSNAGMSNSKKPTNVNVSKRSDFGERYHTINKQLENMSEVMDRASDAADKLWSRDRLSYLSTQNEMLDEEIKLLRQKNEEAKKYFIEDKSNLNSAAADLGFSILYGTNGEILNYNDIVNKYASQMIEAQKHINSLSTREEQDIYQEAVIDPLQEKIDAFESSMKLYYDTLDVITDNNKQIQEKLDQQLQNNFDKWSQEMELDIAINERDLDLLDYYLSKNEDSIYSMVEAITLMAGSLSELQSNITGGQLREYLNNLNIYTAKMDELNQQFSTGEITAADYEEGLESIRSGLLDNLSSLNELDSTMLHYYGETLTAASEELDKYTSLMSHHTEVLDHYSSLLELIGKSKDWQRMKTVLSTQVDVAKNAAAVSKENYEMLAEEAKIQKALYDNLDPNDQSYEANLIRQQWMDAQNAANEAQNQMLSDAESWAESLKSLLETELSELAEILNESLSGEFGSLDDMMSAMDRANSLQEEFLTTTNQIYETNKLMRTAQQEIDKSTNSVAKQRLKEFIRETDQLQDKSKLSQYELEIQQARYDLLLAEIALEEAQNAKSTVRLQRDSEGNFGYVYTADQNEVANARQELEDAQNALYNIGLEGANKYAENYAQTIQEMNDAITELTEQWQNGEIASKEEYQTKVLELEEYYNEKLLQYSELRNIALTADSRVAADAWTRDFADMTLRTEEWMINVDNYIAGVEEAMSRYQTGIDEIEQSTGMDLDSLKTKTENIKTENELLTESIIAEGGLIDALSSEIKKVDELTDSYRKLWTEMAQARTEAEKLIGEIGKTISIESTKETESPKNSDIDPTLLPSGGTSSNGNNPTSGNGSGIGYDNQGYTDADVREAQNFVHTTEDGKWGPKSRAAALARCRTESIGEVLRQKRQMLSEYGIDQPTKFDSGGYTGSWDGSYGKLAFLHQKELVLNAQDTENFLASMDILDKIVSTIDLYSTNAQLGGLLSTPRYGGFSGGDVLEQSVHIEASFPNVLDRNEIEEAFNNLINTASQYANRK